VALTIAGVALALGDRALGLSIHRYASRRPGWLAVAFIGLSSGIGYWLWLWALTNATPTRVMVFLSLRPITAALLGLLLLGEMLSLCGRGRRAGRWIAGGGAPQAM
jgi:drug/metabolite transporter (DMT)-like permease